MSAVPVPTLHLTGDDRAVLHLAEFCGEGTWRSLCNVLDLARYTDEWACWTARTYTARHRPVELSWHDDTRGDRAVCARCIANWRYATNGVREFLRERGAA